MSELSKFMETYNSFALNRRLYMDIKEFTTGIPRWRIHILERNAAPSGGDRELLCIEHKDKTECLRMATAALKTFPIIFPKSHN